jgi:hypothetical protein
VDVFARSLARNKASSSGPSGIERATSGQPSVTPVTTLCDRVSNQTLSLTSTAAKILRSPGGIGPSLVGPANIKQRMSGAYE